MSHVISEAATPVDAADATGYPAPVGAAVPAGSWWRHGAPVRERQEAVNALQGRVDWVDYAKAIGILLVVYGHVARGLYKRGIELPSPLYELADSVIYTFHMPLFFFLSGLFFFESFLRSGGKRLVMKKIDTVFYPYLVWSLLQGSAEVALSSHTNGAASMADVLALLWAPRAQFWFLYALFVIFAASAVIYTFTPRKACALILPVAVGLHLSSSVADGYWITEALLNNFVFFVLGIVFTARASIDHLASTSSLMATLAAFVAGQWVFHGPLHLDYTDHGVLSLGLACISILFVVSLSTHLARRSYGVLAYIGASSMAIYVMHVIAGSGARILSSKLLGLDSPSLHLAIGCASGIFVPLLVLRLVERYRIPYLFSAPLSVWFEALYKKVAYQAGR